MQYDKRDSLLTAGFAIVKQYDARTYARMEASSWTVTTDPMEAGPLAQGNAFGATLARRDMERYFGIPFALSFLHEPSIEAWAEENNVHAAMFAASVLVHEFRHTTQGGKDTSRLEIPAFKAGAAFASKLPAPDGPAIKELSDATLLDCWGIQAK